MHGDPARYVGHGPISFTSEHDRVSFEFGAVCRLLSATPRRLLRLGSIEAHLLAPIRLQQLLVVFGPREVPLGYASWAYLSDAAADQLERDPAMLLHLSDWNAGSRLWIMDFVAIRGRTRPLARALRRRLGRAHRTVSVRRYDRSDAEVRLLIIPSSPVEEHRA